MAASDARLAPRKNEICVVPVTFFKSDGTIITTWTGADSEVSKDYAQAADCTNEATEIDAPTSGKWGVGYLELTATEMNCDFVLVKITVTNTGALPFVWSCVPESAGDVRSDAVMLGGVAQSATDLKDFADTGYDPTTHKVQGVVLTDTLTTYTNNTPQTGDAYAAVGGLNDLSAAEVNAEVDTALSDYDPPTHTEMTTEVGAVQTHGDTAWATAVGFSTHAVADIWDYLVTSLGAVTTVGGYIKSIIDAIKASTDTIGVGATFVQSSVDASGNVTLYRGKQQLLKWTSTDTRDLLAAGVVVKFEYGYGAEAFSEAVTVTGSVGAWALSKLHDTATNAPPKTYKGELALYDGSPELLAVSTFDVIILNNPGL